jgi:uncharacterized membrane protein
MLFLAVLLGVHLRCLLSVPMGVKLVGARCEGMMCRFLVMSGLIMLGRFPVVSGGVRAMFCRLLVKFRSFLRHGIFLQWISQPQIEFNASLSTQAA